MLRAPSFPRASRRRHGDPTRGLRSSGITSSSRQFAQFPARSGHTPGNPPAPSAGKFQPSHRTTLHRRVSYSYRVRPPTSPRSRPRATRISVALLTGAEAGDQAASDQLHHRLRRASPHGRGTSFARCAWATHFNRRRPWFMKPTSDCSGLKTSAGTAAAISSAAAQVMRRSTVERACRARVKRSDIDPGVIIELTPNPDGLPIDILGAQRVLERLECHEPLQAQIVMLRYFAGLTNEHATASILRRSRRNGLTPCAWLKGEMEHGHRPGEGSSDVSEDHLRQRRVRPAPSRPVPASAGPAALRSPGLPATYAARVRQHSSTMYAPCSRPRATTSFSPNPHRLGLFNTRLLATRNLAQPTPANMAGEGGDGGHPADRARRRLARRRHPDPAPSARAAWASSTPPSRSHPAAKSRSKVICPASSPPRCFVDSRMNPHVLGLLQHPGIARVYEAGTEGSGPTLRPFFAMELVTGLALRFTTAPTRHQQGALISSPRSATPSTTPTPRRHPPRSQARQHPRRLVGRSPRSSTSASRASSDEDGVARATATRAPSPANSSAHRHMSPEQVAAVPTRPKSTSAPTCTRWASSCTNCSRAAARTTLDRRAAARGRANHPRRPPLASHRDQPHVPRRHRHDRQHARWHARKTDATTPPRNWSDVRPYLAGEPIFAR